VVSKIKASHILIMHKDSQNSRSDISKEKAFEEIEAIYKQVVDGEVSFADAAVKHSDCSSAETGGNLGEFGKGMMVKPFEEMAFSLEINQVSKPFESEFGYHIVKREA
tara:strand:- start:471 stop:794 length:324 start_codon:yes stop_codon:yes gene_type:complete